MKRNSLIAMGLLIILTFSVSLASGKQRRKVRSINERFALDQRLSETNGAKIKAELAALLKRQDVQLFLAVIQKAEAGEPNIMVGGCRAKTLKFHPAYTLPKRCWYWLRYRGDWVYSTASGNYQITLSNWKELAKFLGLRDFSVRSQQLAALELIRRGGGARSQRTQTGFVKLVQGNLNAALCVGTVDWASSWCSPLPANHKFKLTELVPTVARGMNRNRQLKTGSKSKIAHHTGKRRSR